MRDCVCVCVCRHKEIYSSQELNPMPHTHTINQPSASDKCPITLFFLFLFVCPYVCVYVQSIFQVID